MLRRKGRVFVEGLHEVPFTNGTIGGATVEFTID